MISQDGWKIIVTCVVLLSLASASVGFRLYGRKLKGKSLCFNDYAIVLSLVFYEHTSFIIMLTCNLDLWCWLQHERDRRYCYAYSFFLVRHLIHKLAAVHAGLGYDIVEVIEKLGNDALETGLKVCRPCETHKASTGVAQLRLIVLVCECDNSCF